MSEQRLTASGGPMQNGGMKASSEAWDRARHLLDKAKSEQDLKDIEELCELMNLTDARLMLRRIAAKREFLRR